MGMKIRQESRVRTFFKKFFRFPKKDKKWDKFENVEYTGSKVSIISISVVNSTDSLEKNDRDNDVLKENKDHHDSVLNDSNTEEKKIKTEEKKKKKNKKWKVKVDLKETKLVEIKKYEAVDESMTISECSVENKKDKKEKKKKNNKSKRVTSIEDEIVLFNTGSDEQDLVDVDLDLVLSSFPNIRNAGKEADDNYLNDQLIANQEFGDSQHTKTSTIKDVVNYDVAALEHDEVWLSDKKKSKRNKQKKNKKDKDMKQVAKADKSQQKDKKLKKKRISNKTYESVDEVSFQSIELNVSQDKEDSPHVFNEDDVHDGPNFERLPKKSKRNRKRNVRHPEDDFEEEMLCDQPRRRKHQDLWLRDVIADLDTPNESIDEITTISKRKKFKRRKLKLKLNKKKKKLDGKCYHELDGISENGHSKETSKKNNAREVGRRMWKACKTGWRHMKAGLIFYTKSPASAMALNPGAILRQYSDNVDEQSEPSTSYRSGY